MRRRMMVVGVVALAVGSAALAQGMRGTGRSTLAVLNQRIPDVQLTDVRLEGALEWLGEMAQVNILPRWATLEAAGVTRETEVTVRVRNLRLGQILGMILNEAGGPDVKLAYRASGDLIVVSTVQTSGRSFSSGFTTSATWCCGSRASPR